MAEIEHPETNKILAGVAGSLDWVVNGNERLSGCCPRCHEPVYIEPSFWKRHSETDLWCPNCLFQCRGIDFEGVPNAGFALEYERPSGSN